MTTSAELLADAFERVREGVHEAVDGLTPDQLAERVDGDANSIAWLIWHLTRVQDDHVAKAAGIEQAWTVGGWEKSFGLPFARSAHGYGQTGEEVAQVRDLTAQQLAGYHDAVYEQTLGYVRGLTDPDLDRIVDRSWNPPVTLAVRLVSVVNDTQQHVGQAAFVRGLVLRRR